MPSTKSPAESSSKQDESVQQAPTAPPDPEAATMGPPPSYNEAISTPSFPPIQSPTLYPMSTPYPIVNSSTMPLQSNQPPYPVGNEQISSPMYSPTQQLPIGFSETSMPVTTLPSSQSYPNPIVDQPSTFINEQYVHPKTYVVLQDERQRNQEDCSCTDWLMCCVCCMETCRCLAECFDVFSK